MQYARLPAQVDRAEPPCRAQGACAPGCTRRRDNAHKIEELEVLYQWHPWFGRVVHVHEVIEQRASGVLRCSPDGDASRRWLELPQWMFDRAACLAIRMAASTACRYCGAHNLENVSCGCVGYGLVRWPSIECLCFWCREELLQPASGSCPCDTSTAAHPAIKPSSSS